MQTTPTAPGWYTDPHQPATVRYWDGATWTNQTAPAPAPAAAQYVTVQAAAGPRYLSGMSTGAHIVNGTLTVASLGLWAPIWWLLWRLKRQAIR